jgi:hypothetical protein
MAILAEVNKKQLKASGKIPDAFLDRGDYYNANEFIHRGML